MRITTYQSEPSSLEIAVAACHIKMLTVMTSLPEDGVESIMKTSNMKYFLYLGIK